MNTTYSVADVHWLTEPAAPSLLLDSAADVVHQPIPMPQDMGHGWLEVQHLALGMTLFRGTHHFTPAMAGRWPPFVSFTADLSERHLCIQSARYGQVRLHEREMGTELLFGAGVDFFHHTDRIDIEPHLDGSALVEVSLLMVGDSVLHQLLGETLSRTLLVGLGVPEAPSARVLAVPHPITAPLYATLSSAHSGPLRKLLAQSRILEYLSNLTGYIDIAAPGSPALLPIQRHRRAERLREELTSLQGSIPTLDELARRHHSSARTLNDDFKQIFGLSIFAFVTKQRLGQAHALLKDSDIPLKQLSARLGYSHVNHFSAAFRRLYGYPPGSLRQ